MKLIAIVLTLLVVTTFQSSARSMKIWTYEELVEKSDIILILSVEDVSKRTGKQQELQGKAYDSVLTKFKIKATLKGKHDSSYLPFHHLCYSADTKLILNGWGFRWFSKKDDTYLAFLKKTENGSLIPVAGHGDLGLSFLNIAPDSATSVASMGFDWKTNSPNKRVDLTVKTPVESGKAQGTAGHP